MISIDNVGVSIWGWIFGGAIIGLSFSESTESNVTSRTKKSSIEINWQRLIVSNVAILLSLLLIVPLYNGERYTWLARAYYDPNSNDIKIQEQFKKYSNQALKSKFINNDYKNIILSNLYSVDQSTAIEQLSQINRDDYRNLDTLSLLAGGNEFTGNFTEAIKIRKEIAKYDPWNALNYLSLGILYKNMNDSENMKLMLAKIQSFASGDPIARQAREQLVLKSK